MKSFSPMYQKYYLNKAAKWYLDPLWPTPVVNQANSWHVEHLIKTGVCMNVEYQVCFNWLLHNMIQIQIQILRSVHYPLTASLFAAWSYFQMLMEGLSNQQLLRWPAKHEEVVSDLLLRRPESGNS